MTWLHATFAASRRQTYPTAIDLMPPVFLAMASRLAPNSAPCTDAGTFPSSNRLVRSVIADRSGLFSGAPCSRSLMCCGLKLSGPPAEPLGNDCIADLTARGKTWRGGLSDDGAGRLSAGTGGCRRLNSTNVDMSGTDSRSSEQSRRTAPLTSPSSSLTDAIAAAIWSTVLVDFVRRAGRQLGGSESMPSSN